MTWRDLPWQGQKIGAIRFCGTGKDTIVTIVDYLGRERIFEMSDANARVDVRGSVTTRVVGVDDDSLSVEYSDGNLFLAEARVFDYSTDEEWREMLRELDQATDRRRLWLMIPTTRLAEFVLVSGTG